MPIVESLDRELLFFFNGLHTPWLDPIMFYLSKTYTSLPVYALLLYLIVKNFRSQTWIILLGVAITIVLSDQITSGLMKPFFERLRPTHDPSVRDFIHTVNGYRGGKFGFASSHAANTFATAMFMWLLFRNQYRHVGWLFGWAVLISFTRVYLGVHFPGDVVVGALVGCLCGYGVFVFTRWAIARWSGKQKSPA